MTATLTADAPAYIARSAHAGRWTRRIRPNATRVGHYTAAELVALAPTPLPTGEIVLWESAGTTRTGEELFCRSRFLPQADGSLVGYDADGRRIITHPADRLLRILTR